MNRALACLKYLQHFALRDYVADRVFDNGALQYSYFLGGYFDADGAPHYLHTDYQGSVVMVTDSAGTIEQHTTYYPYGEPHRAPTGQPILYGGKERLATTDDYNFDARRYHAPTLLMSAPDPCATQFPHLSPFIYCAGNPIKYTDVTGRKFTAGAEIYVKMLTDEINARMMRLKKEIADIDNQLSQENLSPKEQKKLEKERTKANQKVETYKGINEEINTLRESDQWYDIQSSKQYNTSADRITSMGGQYKSGAFYESAAGIFKIKLGQRTVDFIAHELKHAYQFETGQISYGPNADGYPFYDVTDEIEAHERGHLFGQTITESVYQMYRNLQRKQSSVPQDAVNDPEKLQQIANDSNSSFRSQGKTYSPQ